MRKNDQPAERTREQRNRRTSLNERVRKDQTREKVSKNYSEQENGIPNNGGNARRKEREKRETNVTNLFFTQRERENETDPKNGTRKHERTTGGFLFCTDHGFTPSFPNIAANCQFTIHALQSAKAMPGTKSNTFQILRLGALSSRWQWLRDFFSRSAVNCKTV